MQSGEAPAFIGEGSTNLVCRCGNSVLIHGYLPRNFLSIRIRCFRCGEVSITPGLPPGEILAGHAVAVSRTAQLVPIPAMIPLAAVLACEDAIAADLAQTRPRAAPTEPMVLSVAALEPIATEYAQLGGDGSPDEPVAWALRRLREKLAIPGWTWLHDNDDDAMAAVYVAAFRHWLACWGEYPCRDWIAPLLTTPERFLRTMNVFATAKLLLDAGNRVGFSLPSPAEPQLALHFSAGGDALSLAVRSPAELQWPARAGWTPRTVLAAVAEAVASAHGQVNRSHPGILLLATSILMPNFDQAVVDGIHAVLRSFGRRHRGLAGIAAITPKVWRAQRLDQINFGYGFYPIQNPQFANPQFVGGNPIRMGPQQPIGSTA